MRYYNPDPNLKRCCKCKQWIEKSLFPRNRSTKDGLNQICKSCRNGKSFRGKKCKGCNELKPLSDYDYKYPKKHQYSAICKECVSKKPKPTEGRGHRRLHVDGKKECAVCRQFKELADFHKNSGSWDGIATRCKSCVKKYHQDNSEHISAKRRAWQKNNPDKVRKYTRDYQKRNHYKQMKSGTDRRIIRMVSLPNTLTNFEWIRALEYFNGCCAVCGRQLADLFKTHLASADHWQPLSKGGATTALNIVPLCHGVGGCNNRKHNHDPVEWVTKNFSKNEASKILARIDGYFAWVKAQV